MMKTVLVISFSDLARDPRVNRQIRFLADQYRVVAAGFTDPGIPGVNFIAIDGKQHRSRLGQVFSLVSLLAHRYEYYYWSNKLVQQACRRLPGIAADLVIANDLSALPLALRLAGRHTKVLFDAHEYAPRELEDQWQFRVFFQQYRAAMCQRYIPRVAGMLTVSGGIADAYTADTGVRPTVVTNAPDYLDLRPSNGTPPQIRMVHHGAADPSRQIEGMIELMRHLDDRFELHLMLVPDPGGTYYGHLRRQAGHDARIKFLDPVPMREIPAFINRFDIGLYILRPINFNNLHALPNKLFEFVQGRLALAIGPSPEMARIVKEHQCGVVAADFSPVTMATALSGLDVTAINTYKNNSHRAARVLSAETNRSIVRRVVADLIGH